MKKVFLLAMVAFMTLAMSHEAKAIEDPNPSGTLVVGARAGLFYGYGANVVADYTLVDYWWKGHFTIGGYTGFNWNPWRVDTETVERYGFWNWALMPRATYGLNITNDFEVHVGVMAGFCVQRWPNQYVAEPNRFLFTHGEFAGVRYMFTDNFGVEAEVIYSSNFGAHGYDPYGMSYFNIGVTFKF